MHIPVLSLLHLTDLIKEGTMEIYLGKTSVRVGRDVIQVDIYDAEKAAPLLHREDILPQLRSLSEEFCKAGKTLVIRYRNSEILKLGADADSIVLGIMGMDHVSMGNPVTIYRFLRKWRKNEFSF
jgi:hypothetical protein